MVLPETTWEDYTVWFVATLSGRGFCARPWDFVLWTYSAVSLAASVDLQKDRFPPK